MKNEEGQYEYLEIPKFLKKHLGENSICYWDNTDYQSQQDSHCEHVHIPIQGFPEKLSFKSTVTRIFRRLLIKVRFVKLNTTE